MPGRKKTNDGIALLETREGAQQLLDLAETGLNIDRIAKTMQIPRGSITKWMGEGNHASLFARAREVAADQLAVDALEIADAETGDVARDRLRVDVRKWLASKWNRQQYGDDKGGVAVQLNLGDLHLQAVKTVKPSPDSTIDHTPTDER